jgi:hypothetical protein
LIPGKPEDSLAKRTDRTGISCSGPSDLDRAAEISSTKRRGTRGFYPLDPDPVVLTRAQPDLIPTAHFGSDGWRGKGMGSGPVAAIARRRCVPVTGARRTWSNPHDTRNPHGASAGLGGSLDGWSGGGGGSVRQRQPAMRVPSLRTVYDLPKSAQEKGEVP